MATFIIDEKEYDLKIDYNAVKRLNNAFEGGSYELIGKALAGDIEAFPIIVHAALLHTGEKFTLKKVESAVNDAFEAESISLDGLQKITNEVITESFFYKPTVTKLMKQNPEMKQAYESLLG